MSVSVYGLAMCSVGCDLSFLMMEGDVNGCEEGGVGVETELEG